MYIYIHIHLYTWDGCHVHGLRGSTAGLSSGIDAPVEFHESSRKCSSKSSSSYQHSQNRESDNQEKAGDYGLEVPVASIAIRTE